ncbi:MAG: hypothetical protein IKJ58_10690, partial [Akkermansia sp.]|nr:hypothetical protein [Akkermansia sp.]
KYFKNTTLGMVGVFSSMLNLFLLFTDTFLLCRFFLAWLIPQLLQKSQQNTSSAPCIGSDNMRVKPKNWGQAQKL